jgi:hypothetical protein
MINKYVFSVKISYLLGIIVVLSQVACSEVCDLPVIEFKHLSITDFSTKFLLFKPGFYHPNLFDFVFVLIFQLVSYLNICKYYYSSTLMKETLLFFLCKHDFAQFVNSFKINLCQVV